MDKRQAQESHWRLAENHEMLLFDRPEHIIHQTGGERERSVNESTIEGADEGIFDNLFG